MSKQTKQGSSAEVVILLLLSLLLLWIAISSGRWALEHWLH